MSNILPWDGVLNDIKDQIGFIDGVVISGGEPTLHPHLLQIIDDIRALGLAVKLDTNGSNFNLLKMLVEKHLVDYVAMDVKAPLDKYRELGFIREGENAAEILDNVKKSIDFLKQLSSERSQGVKGVTPLFRTTPIPELTENDIAEIKKLCEGRRWVRNHFIPQA
jgi:pyruvate formate lyase activating enzyme